MAKRFNITGTCFPDRHYMADVSGKMKSTMELVEAGEYFIINRPRQYGKTTTLRQLANLLRDTGDYIVLNTSFEGLGDTFFSEEILFAQGLPRQWAKYAALRPDSAAWVEWLMEQSPKMNTFDDVAILITQLLNKTDKRVVLMIDEVDKSSNNQLFVSFLAMLRNKYLERADVKTFHSVVLAGVHDVKTLKLKLRPDDEKKYNSPWNIAADFTVDMNLQPHEIRPMLEDYMQERGVEMDAALMAERLFYFTSGYPFLVSKLCKMLDETFLPKKDRKEWTPEDLETAVLALLQEANITNFDSLRINLEHNPDLYALAQSVIIEGNFVEYNPDDPAVELGATYGLFVRSPETGGIAIHNRVYRERIANYMISKLRTTALIQFGRRDIGAYNFTGQFVLPGNFLNMELVLLRFQAFMREQFSEKDHDFLERNGRLIFLAFLRPILNGGGWDFKEPQVSDEKRLDVVVTYFQRKYIVELKIWRGDAAHEKGLLQLADYLDRQNLREGYLLIFDHSKKKTWKHKPLEVQGKKIFAVWA